MVFIPTLSASKEDTFDECKLKYLLKYVDKLPPANHTDDGALKFGNFIHKIFELNPHARTLQELESCAESLKENTSFPNKFNDKIKTCLVNYLALIASFPHLPDEPKPEWYYKLKIGKDEIILGIIDRIVKGKDGGILIVDWKTGRETTKAKLMHNKQLMGYVLACHIKFGVPINKIVAAHFYPVSNTLLTIKYSKQQIQTYIKGRIDKFWVIRKLRKSEFLPCQNENCNWCEYKKLCPVYGGTPAMYQEAVTERKEAPKDSRMDRGEPEEIALEKPVF